MRLMSDAKFKETLTRALKNDIRDLVNFHGSSWNSENLHFERLLLSITYKVWIQKVQKSYLLWHWRVFQTLKKNWLFVWKNDMRNFVNFNMSSGKSEDLHFAVWYLSSLYFCRKNVIFELKNTEELCRKKWLMVSKMT